MAKVKFSKKVPMLKRIAEILERLNAGERISTQMAADFYDISTRTAERDFTEKIPKYLGVQLLKEELSKRWYIVSETRTKALLLDEEEELTLNLMIEQSKSNGVDFYKNTMKLVEKFKDSLYVNSIFTKLDIEDTSAIKQQLIIVEKAIENKNILSCIYKGSKRIIKPLKLAIFDGFWYLIFKDTKNDSIRKYYFKEIEEIEVLQESFEDLCENLQKKLDNAINAYFDADKEPFLVELFIEKEVSIYFKRKPISKSQRIIKEYIDGSIEIELFITHDMEIIPTIKKYSPHVKVLSPGSLDSYL